MKLSRALMLLQCLSSPALMTGCTKEVGKPMQNQKPADGGEDGTIKTKGGKDKPVAS